MVEGFRDTLVNSSCNLLCLLDEYSDKDLIDDETKKAIIEDIMFTLTSSHEFDIKITKIRDYQERLNIIYSHR